MSTLCKYVLVDLDDQYGETVYDGYDEAVQAADDDHAVVELQYELADSELVWTPKGGSTWPPKGRKRA